MQRGSPPYSGEKNCPSFGLVGGGVLGCGAVFGGAGGVCAVPAALGAGKPIMGGGGVGGTGVTVTREALGV